MNPTRLLLTSAAVVLFLMAACGDDDGGHVPSSPTPVGTLFAPDITGQITDRTDGNAQTLGTILIERSNSGGAYDRAWVYIDPETEIVSQSGAPLRWDDLVLGATVAAIFEGIIDTSDPIQVDASKIVVIAALDATP